MTTETADTQSVLDMMTKGIMARKEQAAARLTPVGQERTSAIPTNVPGAMFPNDNPNEVLETAVKAIRREVGYIIQALDNIDATNGVPAATPPTADPVKEGEKAADAAAEQRAFEERMKELREEAQEIAFGPIVHPSTTWRCPTHDTAETRTSKRGRVYGACPKCDEFER